MTVRVLINTNKCTELLAFRTLELGTKGRHEQNLFNNFIDFPYYLLSSLKKWKKNRIDSKYG